MFDVNNNDSSNLQQDIQRVTEYVESTLPKHALENGTNVMVMQTSCNTPGCVPLETSVIIVFPSDTDNTQYIQGLPQSCGGSFRTKILLPLNDVTLDDVLDSLPPCFEGGRKTLGNTCVKLRDLLLCKIGQTVGHGDSNDEVQDRKLIADYLIASLHDYVANGCNVPSIGLPFSFPDSSIEDTIVTSATSSDPLEQNINSSNGPNPYPHPDTCAKSTEHQTTAKNRDESTVTVTRNPSDETSKDDTHMSSMRNKKISIAKNLIPNSSTIIQQLASRDNIIACSSRNSSCPCCDENSFQGLKLETSMLS